MNATQTPVNATVICGDCRDALSLIETESVQCVVTSPPYWQLRNYDADGQIGQESNVLDYVAEIVSVFEQLRRCLKADGAVWLNIGDRYLNTKNLAGLPWRVAFALQNAGWILRQDVIWHKPNPMPESVRDRCTKAHEYVFLLTKNRRYYFDAAAIQTTSKARGDGARFGGSKYGDSASTYDKTKSGNKYQNNGTANRRSVWKIATSNYSGAHCAVFPLELATRCILASSKPGDVVCDPFAGSGTTGIACVLNGRKFVGVEINPEHAQEAQDNIASAKCMRWGMCDTSET